MYLRDGDTTDLHREDRGEREMCICDSAGGCRGECALVGERERERERAISRTRDRARESCIFLVSLHPLDKKKPRAHDTARKNECLLLLYKKKCITTHQL